MSELKLRPPNEAARHGGGMKQIIIVVVGLVAGLAATALEQLGIGTRLRDRKGRFLSVLIVMPIALVCAVAIAYSYLEAPLWLMLVLAPMIVALGVTAGILLVGRSLPDKISSRAE